jgi:(p)ppGpp synthase/HD superfamily hydrolase
MLSKDSFDITLRLRLRHRAGSLAELAATIADADALIGDVTTERLADRDSIRLVTIESTDQAHANRVVSTVRALDHV